MQFCERFQQKRKICSRKIVVDIKNVAVTIIKLKEEILVQLTISKKKEENVIKNRNSSSNTRRRRNGWRHIISN